MLRQITSPHARGSFGTSRLMLEVLLATVPGIVVLTYFYGWGVLINLLLASVLAIVMEALVMLVRKRPVGFYIKDYSALVTAVLLALAIPPYSPWWIMAIGIFFSIVVAKHAYGGLGYNPFNPAMIGYVVLLISFPAAMSTWALPSTINGTVNLPGLADSFAVVFFERTMVDGLTGATVLDLFRQNNELMIDQLYANNRVFTDAMFAGVGTESVNIAFLLGGIYLLVRRIYTWHGPVGMLGALTLCTFFGYDGGSSASQGSALLHLFSGATMLGAFFIITDPVSGCTSNRGRFIFGACVGLLVYLIRAFGNYPDSVAFAVLLMNFAAPLIDYYTQPRTYGHKKPSRARVKHDT